MPAKTEAEIKKLQEGGKILGNILQQLAARCQPGITYQELDKIAEEMILAQGGKPSFKGYDGFPATVCISPTDGCVHGMPNETEVREGDLIKLDIGMWYEGLCTDTARTVEVGEVDSKYADLSAVTKEALYRAIDVLKPGVRVSEIAKTIQQTAEASGYQPIKVLCGHGVGHQVHEDPYIPNYWNLDGRYQDAVLGEGMVIAIEPIISLTADEIKKDTSGWNIKTIDGSACAHWEHTIAITKNGPIVCTETD